MRKTAGTHHLHLSLTAALAFLTMPAQSSVSVSTQTLAPRPFGFVIGDLIPHRIEVEADAGLKLKTDALPKAGRINYWLELREPEIKRIESSGKIRYTVDLVYQTFYAPREVETLAVPGFTLTFEGAGNEVESAVEPWYFTMSVIRENSVLAAEGRDYIRPDDPPDLFETKGPKTRLSILAGALLLSIGGAAYHFGFLPFSRRGRIFADALRKLDRLGSGPDDLERMRVILGIVHGAFNKIHGRPLFHDALEGFWSEHPGFRRIELDIIEFFQVSNGLFFSESSETRAYSLDKAIELCRSCRAIERGLG